MKIAHLFSYAGGGGAEAHALDLAKGNIAIGDEVVFIISSEAQLVSALKKEGIKYVSLKMESSFNPFAVLISVVRLKKIIKEEKIDIVHTHMLREQSLTILAKLLGIKVKLVRTFHRLDQFNWKMKPLMWLYNWQTDAFIAISEYMKSYLNRNGIRNKVYTIYNGVSEIKIKKSGELMGNLGRLSPEKGLYNFFYENNELFKKERFVLGGDGPDEGKIKALIQEKELKIDLMDRIVEREKFFNKIGVFVLPSKSEALPLVVLESFSAGIPVVAFDLPTMRELIQEELRVTPGDYKKLAEVAVFALTNKEKYGKENREKYLKDFQLKSMLEKTQKLYLKLVFSCSKL